MGSDFEISRNQKIADFPDCWHSDAENGIKIFQ